MHVRLWFCLTLSALSITNLAAAQTPAQSSPPSVRVSDGGASGPMQSIFIPPKAGAPFSLTLAAEWTRPMSNGGSITLANERRIVRDSKGRIYQERWILVPKGGKVKSEMNVFQITDPNLHTWFNCEVRTKVCELLTYHFRSDQNYQPAIGTTGPLPDGQGYQQHEDLGEGSAAGVDTHGYRETVTVNAGVMGNDRDMVSTREFWYSPQLGIDVISIVDSPTTGKQVFTVRNLSMMEPEENLFVVPGDYKIVDHRTEH